MSASAVAATPAQRSGQRESRLVWRVLVGHGCAAVGMSVPWPLLLLLVWERTHDGLLLGLAGAARMAPYVALSWAAGQLADKWPRGRVVRWSVIGRLVAMLVAGAALAVGQLVPALVAATVAIAIGTPAYPALAAAMPDLDMRSRKTSATELLVTIEVASFVVGPALGGLLLATGDQRLVLVLAVVMLAVAAWLARGLQLSTPHAEASSPRLGEVLRGAGVAGALAVMSLVNFVVALVGLALVPMAERLWSQAPWAYGLAAAALGFGALAAPILGRALGEGRGLNRGCLVLGLGLLAVAANLGPAGSLLPLAVIGAVAVHIEAMATALVQNRVADECRAGVLGLADTTMVAAALAGSLLGPVLVAVVGPQLLLALTAGASVVATKLLISQDFQSLGKEIVAWGLPNDANPQ